MLLADGNIFRYPVFNFNDHGCSGFCLCRPFTAFCGMVWITSSHFFHLTNSIFCEIANGSEPEILTPHRFLSAKEMVLCFFLVFFLSGRLQSKTT
jgi:hypothetical protein